MSDANSQAEDEELEVSLAMYEQLRQEVRAHGKRKSRRYLSSLTVLGVIIGYVFTSGGDARILVLAPYVLAFLYMSHISSMNYVVQLAALLAFIESKLNYAGAEYEFYHGGFNIKDSPRFNENADFDDIDLRVFRSINPLQSTNPDPVDLHDEVQTRVRRVMEVLAVSAYFGTGLLGAVFISTDGIPALGIGPSPVFALTPATYFAGVLLVTYLLLFYQVIAAWDAYQNYANLLEAGVDQVDVEKLEDGVRTMSAADD